MKYFETFLPFMCHYIYGRCKRRTKIDILTKDFSSSDLFYSCTKLSFKISMG